MSGPCSATGQQVEEILVGAVAGHAAGPDRYCRALHIVAKDGTRRIGKVERLAKRLA
jgi:hypothetical protein